MYIYIYIYIYILYIYYITASKLHGCIHVNLSYVCYFEMVYFILPMDTLVLSRMSGITSSDNFFFSSGVNKLDATQNDKQIQFLLHVLVIVCMIIYV